MPIHPSTSLGAIDTFTFKNIHNFKLKALNWATQFEVCCYLDQNDYTAFGNYPFEAVLAIGVQDEIVALESEGAFKRFKNFTQSNKDWLFGFLGYDLKNDTEALSSSNPDHLHFPELHFFRPEILLVIQNQQVEIISSHVAPHMVYTSIEKLPLTSFQPPAVNKLERKFSKQEYLSTIEAIKGNIKAGNIYEMNFCQEFYCNPATFDPYSTFVSLNQIAKAPFSAFYKYHDRYLLCASPERYLKKRGQKITSQPIKGTVKRGANSAEDLHLKTWLKHSKKDRSENVMIVDLVRNDLARCCIPGSVKVEELFGIYPFEQVYQMISTISGTLSPSTHWVDAIKASFPMGSMTGAPKVSAMELIESFEKSKRGLYSGAVGYITPDQDFDFNVVIRSLLYNKSNNYLSFQVGGAIVDGSQPEAEYEECLLKAKGILQTIGLPNQL